MAFRQIFFFCGTKETIKSDASRPVLPGTWKPQHNSTNSLVPRPALQEEQVGEGQKNEPVLETLDPQYTCYLGSSRDFNVTIFSVH